MSIPRRRTGRAASRLPASGPGASRRRAVMLSISSGQRSMSVKSRHTSDGAALAVALTRCSMLSSCTIRYMNATPKDRLLAKVVDVALAGGISDKSLRAIADAAGTSHRMLIHHFGSRDGLLVAVIKAVEAQQ